jgi:hypothetical protein
VRALDHGAHPPLDAPLVDLLVEGGWLRTLAMSDGTWPRVLRVLSGAHGDELANKAIAELATHALYRHAGAVVLSRARTHPAMQSPATQLAALRAHVRRRCAAHPRDERLAALAATLAVRT